MKIIYIYKNLIDVFTGEGWDNWSRWEKSKSGFLKQIGGKPVPGFIKNIIIKELTHA